MGRGGAKTSCLLCGDFHPSIFHPENAGNSTLWTPWKLDSIIHITFFAWRNVHWNDLHDLFSEWNMTCLSCNLWVNKNSVSLCCTTKNLHYMIWNLACSLPSSPLPPQCSNTYPKKFTHIFFASFYICNTYISRNKSLNLLNNPRDNLLIFSNSTHVMAVGSYFVVVRPCIKMCKCCGSCAI